jgi:O-antigen chain-terminating methyltransferase
MTNLSCLPGTVPDRKQAVFDVSDRVQAHLEEAAALVGQRLPNDHGGGWRHHLGRLLARCLLHISRFLAGRQRIYNLEMLDAVRELASKTQRQFEEMSAALRYLQAEARAEQQRIALFLAETRRRLAEPAEEQRCRLDALYAAFEDRFRGSREEIKERQRVYLPLVRQANLGTPQLPILDLGCGRGEWLELLQEAQLHGRGVDSNRFMVAQCRQRGLDVVDNNVLAYLRELPDSSVGLISGFHIVEHLPFDVLIDLLAETARVLATGGAAIFETPNPANVMVGSCTFYFDPTHLHPLPSELLRFLVEAQGLARVEIRELHPYAAPPSFDGTEMGNRFKQLFYGPRDYAVIGWKP